MHSNTAQIPGRPIGGREALPIGIDHGATSRRAFESATHAREPDHSATGRDRTAEVGIGNNHVAAAGAELGFAAGPLEHHLASSRGSMEGSLDPHDGHGSPARAQPHVVA